MLVLKRLGKLLMLEMLNCLESWWPGRPAPSVFILTHDPGATKSNWLNTKEYIVIAGGAEEETRREAGVGTTAGAEIHLYSC